jgi:outer membrane protein insertion porin family
MRYLFVLLLFLYTNSKAQTVKPLIVARVQFSPDFEKLISSDLQEAAGLQINAVFSSHDLNKYANKIVVALNSRGYLYAKIDKIGYTIAADSVGVKVTVSGSPGKIVRVGQINIISDSLKASYYQNLQNVREDDPYSEKAIEDDLNQMLALAADSGFVFAKVQIPKIEVLKNEDGFFAHLEIHVKEGQRAFINKIEISGNSYTKDFVILRELPLGIGQQYSKSIIEKIPQRLLRMGIFKDVKPASILIGEDGKYVLSLEVVEGNATTFDGVVGYIPGTKNSGSNSAGYFTGLVDISFRNLFGTARSFDIHWEKPDRDSENFFLRYTEPWIMGYPIDVSGSLERTVRDTTYLEWKGSFNTRWRISPDFSIISTLQRQVVLPDSLSNLRFRLVRYEQLNLEIGLDYDTRDYAVNPRKGVYFSNSYTLGLKTNFGPSYLLREDNIKKQEQVEILKLSFKWFYELLRNQVFAIQLTGNQVKGNRLQLTDFTWFGGARTLRGYRENQFRGDIAAWMNLEYRFLLGRNTRVFLFNDWGAYHFKDSQSEIEEILPGYGIGIRLDTALGIMAVDFGLGKGDDFSQAKIHFGIVNRF